MKTFVSKTELSNDFLYRTLQAISEVFNLINQEIIVVGATARDLILLLCNEPASKTKTFDLDLAIALKDWQDFDNLVELLQANNFERLNLHQKFCYRGVNNDCYYEVDIVPYGEIAKYDTVYWRPDGVPAMSVRCYEDIMQHAITIKIEEISVRIAPIAGQFLTKLDAWIDRNDRTEKDARDIMLFLQKYYLAMVVDSKSIPEEVNCSAIDDYYLVAGAEWIAVDVKKILSKKHLLYYLDFIRNELELREQSRFLRHLTLDHDEDAEFWNLTEKALTRMIEIWEQ